MALTMAALGTLIAVVVALEILVWRPLRAWSVRFRYNTIATEEDEISAIRLPDLGLRGIDGPGTRGAILKEGPGSARFPDRMLDAYSTRRFAAALKRMRDTAVKQCLAADPMCSGSIVRAHAVQNAFVLDQLAEEGHVYMFLHALDGTTPLTRIGRNKATTFTGYCAHHDATIFREIDLRSAADFRPDSPSQAARFAMRAMARQCWIKSNDARLYADVARLAGAGRTDELQRVYQMSEEDAHWMLGVYKRTIVQLLKGTRFAGDRFAHSYSSLRALIGHGKYHLWKFHAWPITGPPSVAACSAFYVEYDSRGTLLVSRLLHEDTPVVVFNVVPLGGTTWVLLAHHRRFAGRLSRFIEDLGKCTESERGHLVSKLLVTYCECVFSGRCVQALSTDLKAQLEEAFRVTMHDALPYDALPTVNFFA